MGLDQAQSEAANLSLVSQHLKPTLPSLYQPELPGVSCTRPSTEPSTHGAGSQADSILPFQVLQLLKTCTLITQQSQESSSQPVSGFRETWTEKYQSCEYLTYLVQAACSFHFECLSFSVVNIHSTPVFCIKFHLVINTEDPQSDDSGQQKSTSLNFRQAKVRSAKGKGIKNNMGFVNWMGLA